MAQVAENQRYVMPLVSGDPSDQVTERSLLDGWVAVPRDSRVKFVLSDLLWVPSFGRSDEDRRRCRPLAGAPNTYENYSNPW